MYYLWMIAYELHWQCNMDHQKEWKEVVVVAQNNKVKCTDTMQNDEILTRMEEVRELPKVIRKQNDLGSVETVWS